MSTHQYNSGLFSLNIHAHYVFWKYQIQADTRKLLGSWQQSETSCTHITAHQLAFIPSGLHTHTHASCTHCILVNRSHTPVERMVIMHVAKRFSSSWTPYYPHATHLLCLKEQIGSLRETLGPGARVQKDAQAERRAGSFCNVSRQAHLQEVQSYFYHPSANSPSSTINIVTSAPRGRSAAALMDEVKLWDSPSLASD